MTGAAVVVGFVLLALWLVVIAMALKSSSIDARLEEDGKIPGPPAPSDESI